MTDDNDPQTEHHLLEAHRHLDEVQNGDLRQTNAIAIQQVPDTIATVLRERKQDE